MGAAQKWLMVQSAVPVGTGTSLAHERLGCAGRIVGRYSSFSSTKVALKGWTVGVAQTLSVAADSSKRIRKQVNLFQSMNAHPRRARVIPHRARNAPARTNPYHEPVHSSP